MCLHECSKFFVGCDCLTIPLWLGCALCAGQLWRRWWGLYRTRSCRARWRPPPSCGWGEPPGSVFLHVHRRPLLHPYKGWLSRGCYPRKQISGEFSPCTGFIYTNRMRLTCQPWRAAHVCGAMAGVAEVPGDLRRQRAGASSRQGLRARQEPHAAAAASGAAA